MNKGYVALLRGINVGGHNKIAMPKLKTIFEAVGCSDVETYIITGNIIFNHPTQSGLEDKLEEAIEKDFGLRIKVLLKSYQHMEAILEKLPAKWTNDAHMKSDVMFLWEDVDNPSVIEQVDPKTGIDTCVYVTGALLWSVDRQNLTKSSQMKLASSKLYKKMTVRNVNTTRKLWELLQQNNYKGISIPNLPKI